MIWNAGAMLKFPDQLPPVSCNCVSVPVTLPPKAKPAVKMVKAPLNTTAAVVVVAPVTVRFPVRTKVLAAVRLGVNVAHCMANAPDIVTVPVPVSPSTPPRVRAAPMV